MFKNDLNLFLEKLKIDKNLQNKVNSIINENFSQYEKGNLLIKLAEENNFKFTREEAFKLKRSLSDEDLENVSGGISSRNAALTLATLACLSSIGTSSNLIASAFDSRAHSNITNFSTANIKNLGNIAYENVFDDEAKEIIDKSCNLPDEDETDYIWAYHFYNPDTKKNFLDPEKNQNKDFFNEGLTGDAARSAALKSLGIKDTELEEKSKITALSKMIIHYNTAKELYKNGHKMAAMEQLGRSIHYMEDLNTPVHTHDENIYSAGMNAVGQSFSWENIKDSIQKSNIEKKGEHSGFEKICDDISTHNDVTPSDRFNGDNYTINEINGEKLEDYGHNCAIKSKSIYDELKADKIDISNSEIDSVKTAAIKSVQNAKTAVDSLLKRFYNEVKDTKIDNKVLDYGIIKDEENKKWASVTAKTDSENKIKGTKTLIFNIIELDTDNILKTHEVQMTLFINEDGSLKVNKDGKIEPKKLMLKDERNSKVIVEFNITKIENNINSASVSNLEIKDSNVSKINIRNLDIVQDKLEINSSDSEINTSNITDTSSDSMSPIPDNISRSFSPTKSPNPTNSSNYNIDEDTKSVDLSIDSYKDKIIDSINKSNIFTDKNVSRDFYTNDSDSMLLQGAEVNIEKLLKENKDEDIKAIIEKIKGKQTGTWKKTTWTGSSAYAYSSTDGKIKHLFGYSTVNRNLLKRIYNGKYPCSNISKYNQNNISKDEKSLETELNIMRAFRNIFEKIRDRNTDTVIKDKCNSAINDIMPDLGTGENYDEYCK